MGTVGRCRGGCEPGVGLGGCPSAGYSRCGRFFSGAAGHGLVVGAPQTGRSTLLRTVVCALALTHTPSEVHCYCLDFGGGSMQQLQNLPHVGGVSSRLDPEHVRRTAAEIAEVAGRRLACTCPAHAATRGRAPVGLRQLQRAHRRDVQLPSRTNSVPSVQGSCYGASARPDTHQRSSPAQATSNAREVRSRQRGRR
ncbi:FtsK/SpoIIIE domain-containing protein [Streptomyces sp. NPDC002206]